MTGGKGFNCFAVYDLIAYLNLSAVNKFAIKTEGTQNPVHAIGLLDAVTVAHFESACGHHKGIIVGVGHLQHHTVLRILDKTPPNKTGVPAIDYAIPDVHNVRLSLSFAFSSIYQRIMKKARKEP